MPHLSPMSWVVCSLLFFFMLFIFTTIIWWKDSSVFPKIDTDGMKMKLNIWNWE